MPGRVPTPRCCSPNGPDSLIPDAREHSPEVQGSSEYVPPATSPAEEIPRASRPAAKRRRVAKQSFAEDQDLAPKPKSKATKSDTMKDAYEYQSSSPAAKSPAKKPSAKRDAKASTRAPRGSISNKAKTTCAPKTSKVPPVAPKTTKKTPREDPQVSPVESLVPKDKTVQEKPSLASRMFKRVKGKHAKASENSDEGQVELFSEPRADREESLDESQAQPSPQPSKKQHELAAKDSKKSTEDKDRGRHMTSDAVSGIDLHFSDGTRRYGAHSEEFESSSHADHMSEASAKDQSVDPKDDIFLRSQPEQPSPNTQDQSNKFEDTIPCTDLDLQRSQDPASKADIYSLPFNDDSHVVIPSSDSEAEQLPVLTNKRKAADAQDSFPEVKKQRVDDSNALPVNKTFKDSKVAKNEEKNVNFPRTSFSQPIPERRDLRLLPARTVLAQVSEARTNRFHPTKQHQPDADPFQTVSTREKASPLAFAGKFLQKPLLAVKNMDTPTRAPQVTASKVLQSSSPRIDENVRQRMLRGFEEEDEILQRSSPPSPRLQVLHDNGCDNRIEDDNEHEETPDTAYQRQLRENIFSILESTLEKFHPKESMVDQVVVDMELLSHTIEGVRRLHRREMLELVQNHDQDCGAFIALCESGMTRLEAALEKVEAIDFAQMASEAARHTKQLVRAIGGPEAARKGVEVVE